MQMMKKLDTLPGNVTQKTAWSSVVTRWFSLAVALLLLLPAIGAYAQFESASVLGYARDSSGAAVPNTTVTLTNTATGIVQTAKTDGEGKYEFSSVAIGQYVVSTEVAGFERVKTPPLRPSLS